MVHQQHCSLADNTAVNLKGGGPWWQMDGISYAEVTAILEVLGHDISFFHVFSDLLC